MEVQLWNPFFKKNSLFLYETHLNLVSLKSSSNLTLIYTFMFYHLLTYTILPYHDTLFIRKKNTRLTSTQPHTEHSLNLRAVTMETKSPFRIYRDKIATALFFISVTKLDLS